MTFYMKRKQQRVVPNRQFPTWKMAMTGALQSSILGSLLFLININHLSEGLSSNAKLFTNDMPLFCYR